MDDCEYLGAVAWWHNHKTEVPNTGEFELVHLLMTTNGDRITLRGGRNLSRRDLSRVGKKAKAEGALDMRHRGMRRCKIEIAKDGNRRLLSECLYPVPANWDHIDPTLPMFDHSHEHRKINLRGPKWSRNSCAVDALLGLGLLLDWCRTVLDQIDEVRLGKMTALQQAYRAALMKDWGKLGDESKDAVRDAVAQAAHDTDKAKFPIGGSMDVSELACYCLGGVPQLEATTARTGVCCDKKFALSPSRGDPIQHDSFFEISPNFALQSHTALQTYYGHHQLINNRSHSRCTNGTACTQVYTEGRSMMDRHPPMLVELVSGSLEGTKKSYAGMIKNTTVLCTTMDPEARTRSLRYEIVGLISMPGWNHFVARALVGDKILKIDTHTKRTPTAVKDWLALGDLPRVIVWKLKEVSET